LKAWSLFAHQPAPPLLARARTVTSDVTPVCPQVKPQDVVDV
jgi:hypothetical protein